jgi:2-dehydropantoate 2-reductase
LWWYHCKIGVEAHDELSDFLGAERVLGGLCKIASFVSEPGHVVHLGVDPEIVFGEWDNGELAEPVSYSLVHESKLARLEAINACFVQAGIKAIVSANIETALWKKFLFIASWGGVGAVTRVPAGIMRLHPPTMDMLNRQ